MIVTLIAIALFVIVGLAIAHYLGLISQKAAASIDLGGGLVVAFCAVAAFFVAIQQPSAASGNAGPTMPTRAKSISTTASSAVATIQPRTTAATQGELAKPSSQTVTVEPGSTEVLFDGQLRISMFTASEEGKPMYLKFYGQIAGPGLKPQKINAAGPGFSLQYGGYEITLLEVNLLDARVMAVKSTRTDAK